MKIRRAAEGAWRPESGLTESAARCPDPLDGGRAQTDCDSENTARRPRPGLLQGEAHLAIVLFKIDAQDLFAAGREIGGDGLRFVEIMRSGLSVDAQRVRPGGD